MKSSLRHLLWIGLLLCTDVMGQAATYTVKPGDSLARIARRHNCTAQELAVANGLKLSSVIHPGQTLKLPTAGAATGSGGATAVPAGGSHTIQSGETLSAISRRYNIALDALLAANPGINPKTLKVGQKIRVSGTAAEEQKSTPPATPPAAAVKETPPVSETGLKESANTESANTEPAATEPAPAEPEGKIRTVMVDAEMTYGEFAAKHGTDIARLNDLNGLDLTSATVLAKGSELYVPAQPVPAQP
jgi:LysM repeat protein